MTINLLVVSITAAIAGFVVINNQTTPEQQPVKVRTEDPQRKRQTSLGLSRLGKNPIFISVYLRSKSAIRFRVAGLFKAFTLRDLRERNISALLLGWREILCSIFP